MNTTKGQTLQKLQNIVIYQVLGCEHKILYMSKIWQWIIDGFGLFLWLLVQRPLWRLMVDTDIL